MLAWASSGPWQRVTESIYMLHTGRGAPLLGLVLGLLALGVPVMAGPALVIWAARRRGRPRRRGNALPEADTIILVGSEGGSTWGFAATLHAAPERGRPARPRRPHVRLRARALAARRAGHRARRHLWRRRGAGFGQRLPGKAGRAPGGARGTARRSRVRRPQLSRFLRLCAKRSRGRRTRRAGGRSCPLATVDRQSPQDFARWGRALGRARAGARAQPPAGAAEGAPLTLSHGATMAPTCRPRRRSCALPCRGPASGSGLRDAASRASRQAICSASCRRARSCRGSTRWPRPAGTASSRSACASIPAASARANCRRWSPATMSVPSSGATRASGRRAARRRWS